MIPHSRPTIGQEEMEAVARVMRSGMLAQGREVEAFERECAEAVGRRHAVAVSSGTAALHLALLAMGVGRGDRVAMPSYACHALMQAAAMCGAEPTMVDCGEDWQSDVMHAAGCKTRIVAHLFGAGAPIAAGEDVIEDIAQSMGGTTGRQGRLAITSFYATKMMTTGEGGMLLTDDEALADDARDRRDYDNRDDSRPRFAYKMTDMQAAMGRVQLRKLPGFVARRREIGERYVEGLRGCGCTLPLTLTLSPEDGGEGNAPLRIWFRFVISTPRRDELQWWLSERGIDAKRPVHRPGHQVVGLPAEEFPHAERAHREVLSLPIYPGLGDEEVERVIASVRAFFDQKDAG